MTIRQAISQVKSLFKFVSADDLISDRAICNELKDTAIKYIKQQTNQRKLFASPNIFTNLNCIEMETVPLSQCCSYTSPCDISKSKQKIPRISEGIYGLLVQGVYSLDKRNKYKETTATRYANYLKLGLKKEQKFFWIQDGYLYISDPNIELCSISAYFEEDIDESLYSCEEKSQTCPNNPLDLEFKCPSYLIQDVINATYTTVLNTYKRSVADVQTNQLDENK